MADGQPGRPSDYTPELANHICELLETGDSLRQICARDGMPDRTTVTRWLDRHPQFAAKYARAREEQAEHMDDLILETANNCHEENAQAARVKIAAYQWRAAKLKPKKYGDRVEHNHTHSLAEMLGAVPVVTDPLLAGQSSVATLPAKPEPLVIDAESTPITSPDDNS